MMPSNTISILLVDDHMVVRKGLGLVLGEEPGFSVIGEAESGEEAVYLCRKLNPDIVLMDVKMDGMGGAKATQVIAQHHKSARVIGLSTFANRDVVTGMLDAGARGYLLKDISATDLIAAIRRVYHGEILLSDELQAASSDQMPELAHHNPDDDVSELGEQQKRVLALMTKGLTNPEIAGQVGISISTVRYHVSAILRKLDVSNRSEAVALAVRLDLVSAEDC